MSNENVLIFVFHFILTAIKKSFVCVFSVAEKEKSGSPTQNGSKPVQSGVGAQQSQQVTLQVRLVIKLTSDISTEATTQQSNRYLKSRYRQVFLAPRSCHREERMYQALLHQDHWKIIHKWKQKVSKVITSKY